LGVAALVLALTVTSAPAEVRYVNIDSPSPSPPYTNWATAAKTIQDAMDVALAVDEILVTNGVYQTGGRIVYGALSNRVAVIKPVTLRSVNGPEVTVISGYRVPGTTNCNGAVRCVYLTNGATLVGFTLTNGATRRCSGEDDREDSGGGVWCESVSAVISNCTLSGNSAGLAGGGANSGTLKNCALVGNSAIIAGGGAASSILINCTLSGNSAIYDGGGAGDCVLSNCTLTGNSAPTGGGAYRGTLNHCALIGNSAQSRDGGGASDSTLNNCTLTNNTALYGGGAYRGTLNNCTLSQNSALAYGGGAFGSTLNNCALTGNSAHYDGGGAYECTLNNCNVVGNSAQLNGGGTYYGRLNNCIVYYNTAIESANYSPDSSLNFCCTTPQPEAGQGAGNTSADPQLADATHILGASPCRGAGSPAYASGLDIDGEPWANPPSIGCDEFQPGSETGPLTVAIAASFTNVVAGFAVTLNAQIAGQPSASRWEFNDGTVVSNRYQLTYAWLGLGDYPVVLRAFNQTYPGGVSATATVHVVQGVHYVAAEASHAVAPYGSWATAANAIQDAVDAAAAGGLVLVSNGVYQSGGWAVYGLMTNRVTVAKPLTLHSVNGPEVTVIRGSPVAGTTNGDGAVRCVYLTNGAWLVGFTLTNGATRSAGDAQREQSGGGVWCESASVTLSNCVLSGDSAGYLGGGAYGGTIYQCTLAGNSAQMGGGVEEATLDHCSLIGNSALQGGGACGGTLNNCTLTGNSATWGAGTLLSTLRNCVLTNNTAGYAGGGAFASVLNNCMLSGNSALHGGGAIGGTLNNCTLTGNSASVEAGGVGSMEDPDCPVPSVLNNCIAQDNNAPFAANYSPDTHLSYCCTLPLPPFGAGNFTNAPLLVDGAGGNVRLQSNSPCINAGLNAYAPAGPDLDGNPRIAGGTVDVGAYEFQSLSVLKLLSPMPGAPGLVIRWQSVSGLTYFLDRRADLGSQSPFLPLASNIVGQAGTTTYADTNAVGEGPFFYRVGVKN
jgi:hypothetical protein